MQGRIQNFTRGGGGAVVNWLNAIGALRGCYTSQEKNENYH